MLDQKEFKRIKEDMDKFEKQRENIIFLSRIILKSSKSSIYSTHRGEFSKAKAYIEEAELNISKIVKFIEKDNNLETIGAYSSALEEYAEAKLLYGFVKEKKLPRLSDLKVSADEYLLGMCDFTGELARLAVRLATERKFKEVKEITSLIDEIFGFFSSLDLRNSELRKKSDSIKWNLKKVEEILYDISMKK